MNKWFLALLASNVYCIDAKLNDVDATDAVAGDNFVIVTRTMYSTETIIHTSISTSQTVTTFRPIVETPTSVPVTTQTVTVTDTQMQTKSDIETSATTLTSTLTSTEISTTTSVSTSISTSISTTTSISTSISTETQTSTTTATETVSATNSCLDPMDAYASGYVNGAHWGYGYGYSDAQHSRPSVPPSFVVPGASYAPTPVATAAPVPITTSGHSIRYTTISYWVPYGPPPVPRYPGGRYDVEHGECSGAC